jgi:hypothetical protein
MSSPKNGFLYLFFPKGRQKKDHFLVSCAILAEQKTAVDLVVRRSEQRVPMQRQFGTRSLSIVTDKSASAQ